MSHPARRHRLGPVVVLALAVLTLSIAAGLGLRPARARGDETEGSAESLGPTAAQTREFLESGKAGSLVENPETDLQAARAMPHTGLERGEALELAEAVFEPEIEAAGGIYAEIEPERFLSNYAAVVPVSSLPEERGQSAESLAAEHPNTPILLESTLPLRTENASGEDEAVDLGLEHSEGELQPENPLAEVGIPQKLGEGISLSGPEVEVMIAGAPEDKVPSDAGGEFAFYPEVAEDTDLIVRPTPQGVETMTDIRSAEAPMQTTYELSLPAGAELRATEEGGAEVVEGDHATVTVPAPTAIDAAGDPVQTELSVSGGGITLVTTPSPSTVYPILVDPTYISEGWNWSESPATSFSAWTPSSTAASYEPLHNPLFNANLTGLALSAGARVGGYAPSGTHADFEYWLPRYKEDLADFGTPPKSYVYQMLSEGVFFVSYGNSANYPALVLGLVEPAIGWQTADVHYGGQGEMNSWNNRWTLTNTNATEPEGQTADKGADMNLVTYENESPAKRRDVYLPDVYIAVADTEAPKFQRLIPPEHWMNTTPEPIGFEFEDQGLGIRSAGFSFQGSQLPGWGFDLLCSATTASPCPRRVKSSKGNPGEAQASLTYYPGSLPTGRDPLTVTAGDVMWGLGVAGHTFSENVVVMVDHAAPEVSLSGPLTEQGSLGTHRPSYALRINAKDGVEAAPQSGVKKVEIRVDGTKVVMPEEKEWEPSCLTQNCLFNGEWSLTAAGYGAGPHEVQVVATDAVGNVTTKTLQVELHQSPPTLSVSGSMTEQATLGIERPSYKLNINASAPAESPTPAVLPTYSSSFGSSGTGTGQFARPGGAAIDAQGNLWVADSGNNRIEKFNENGGFISQFGSALPAECKLNRPTAIAISATGNLLVTDSGNKRVEEFSPAGACLHSFGGPGEGSGQFAGTGPEGIAVDYHGNIWVCDTRGGRLEKFNENGGFIRSVGNKGAGYEQLGQPTGIAVGPGGNVFVTDWADDKVVEYGEGGAFIRQFASVGKEAGQLEQPTAIAIDSRGDVWVGDEKNNRVEEFNQGGEYLGKFGAPGSGAGQFGLSYPGGIATDTKGDIWVTDTNDNRVEKWVSSNYLTPSTPTYLKAIGATGTGHFAGPMGVAVDAKGNLWAIDSSYNLLEKFNTAGTYEASYGGPGPNPGQFSTPLALAFAGGHLWVGDVGNERVEEFGESGSYVSKFGVSGTGAGQISFPLGIAVDSNHHVWVAELTNSRVQEFSETGTLLHTVGAKGTNGQVNGASGVAVGPGNKVFVADYGDGRIEEFTEAGGFVRQFGGASNEIGHLLEPMGIYVDPAEHVWVVDRGHNRVVEFSGGGEYLGQFGVAGAGAGAFSTPEYITGDASGHLFVSDAGNTRVDEWSVPATHSQVSTEITIDGKRVEATETSCAAEACAATKEWTLQSSSLSAGSHVVVVRATDGLGNTTSKTLNVKVGDTTKPTLEVGGELVSAPAGWIEQEEGNYGLHANATDSGYGVTSVAFTIDGKAVASKTQTCAAGGCSASISTTVNAHALAAGAHEAEVVATDGAGNAATKKWTINVDPEGAISTEEAEATFEALETTSPVNLIGPAVEEEEYEGTDTGLGVVLTSEGVETTGGNVPVTVGINPGVGMQMEVLGELPLRDICLDGEESAEVGSGERGEELPEPPCLPRPEAEKLASEEEEEVARGEKTVGREPITITPVAVTGDSTEVTAVEGVAAVATNTNDAVDTVTRPLSDGGMDFQDIRSTAAPEHYAFELEPYGSQLELRQVSPQVITAYYKEGGYSAFTIEAEPAHDADGHEVPTHLTLNGPLLVTLTVEHRGIASETGEPFVYPVVSGTGWHGGWRSGTVENYEPKPPPAGEEPAESKAGEETFVSAPERSTPEQAGVTDLAMIALSRSSTNRYLIRHIRCGAKPYYDDGSGDILFYGPERFSCGDPFTRTEGSADAEYSIGVRAWIYNSPNHFVSHRGSATDEIECAKMDYPSHYKGGWVEPNWWINPAQRCVWWGPTADGGGSYEPVGKHLTAYGEWNSSEGVLGTAGYVFATSSSFKVDWHKTTCIDC